MNISYITYCQFFFLFHSRFSSKCCTIPADQWQSVIQNYFKITGIDSYVFETWKFEESAAGFGNHSIQCHCLRVGVESTICTIFISLPALMRIDINHTMYLWCSDRPVRT